MDPTIVRGGAGWTHEDEFLCVAFQNRVAHAMGGTTFHSCGDIGVGGQRSSQPMHTDIDIVLTHTQRVSALGDS